MWIVNYKQTLNTINPWQVADVLRKHRVGSRIVFVWFVLEHMDMYQYQQEKSLLAHDGSTMNDFYVLSQKKQKKNTHFGRAKEERKAIK